MPSPMPEYLNVHYICESASRLLFLSMHWARSIPSFQALGWVLKSLFNMISVSETHCFSILCSAKYLDWAFLCWANFILLLHSIHASILCTQENVLVPGILCYAYLTVYRFVNSGKKTKCLSCCYVYLAIYRSVNSGIRSVVSFNKISLTFLVFKQVMVLSLLKPN